MQTPARVRKLSAKRGSGYAVRCNLPTRSEQAHDLLKECIISAKYMPGQFLHEARLCGDLGMGRTPVRQALHRLQLEGLVDVIHGKGVIVKADSLPELMLALEARILVEPFCAARFTEVASAADIDQLAALHSEYLGLRDRAERRTLMEIDRKLHEHVGVVAGNRLLLELLRPIQERMTRLWFMPHWHINDFGETASEHEALLQAIRSRQPDAASQAMRDHLESIKRRIISGGSNTPAYGAK